jgi:hypothetical protein
VSVIDRVVRRGLLQLGHTLPLRAPGRVSDDGCAGRSETAALEAREVAVPLDFGEVLVFIAEISLVGSMGWTSRFIVMTSRFLENRLKQV